MTTIYVAWYDILTSAVQSYNKHLYMVRDLDSNLSNSTDQDIIRGGDNNLTFNQMAANLLAGTYLAGGLNVEAGVTSNASLDGLNNTGDSDGDGFLNNDVDKNGVADTATDRHYTAVDLAPAFTYLGTSDADVVWNAMKAYSQDLQDSDFGYRLLSWNCQATIVSALASVGIDFFNNVPTGSTFGQYVSRNVLLSGDGGYALFGFDGNDRIYDTGGNDTFHGGDGGITQAINYADGTDRIHYVNQGDVTYRYVVLPSNQSAWSAIQDNGTTVSTDTLYSVEEFRGASFPLFNNTIDLSDYGSGLTIQDAPKSNFNNYKDDSSDQISSVMTTAFGAGNVVSFIDMNSFIGTNYADTFLLRERIGRIFDGDGGDDTLDLDIALTPVFSERHDLMGGTRLYIADSVQSHHAGQDVAINIENFDVTVGGGYFIVESMGNDFTHVAYTNTSPTTMALYTTVSYANYTSSLTFDISNRTASDGTNTDAFSSTPSIIGTNNGDTYTGLTLGPSVPTFTGSGDDEFYGTGGAIFYGGGDDWVDAQGGVLRASIGVEVSDVTLSVINARLDFSEETMDWYLGDLLVTIAGYGSITYEAAVDWQFHIVEDGPDFWSADGATALAVYSAFGYTMVSIEPNGEYNLPAPPTWSMATQNVAITTAGGLYWAGYHGSMGDDTIDLSAYTGSRIFYGYDGDDTVQGSTGDDTVYAGGGDDIVDGGGGNDTIDGGTGTNELNGGAGADIYKLVAHSTNILDDSSGSNQLHLSLAQSELLANVIGNSVELYNASGTFHTSIADYRSFVSITFSNSTTVSLASFLNVPVSMLPTPTPGDDAIDARYFGAAVTIDLLAGNDTFYGSGATDTIFGNDGNDVIEVGGGDDVIDGGGGNDTINGQGGTDTLSYASATAGIALNLTTTSAQNTGGAGTDTVRELENLVGSAFNDTLTGNTGNNVIEGGAGNDTLNGNSGTDTVSYANAASAVTVNLTTATAQNTGGAGTDTLSNFENLRGSAFNDTLTGNTGNNVIEGGAGDDTLNGNSGTDTVAYTSASAGVAVSLGIATAQNTLGAGTDTISAFENLTGSAFNDVLTGDANANVIDGGTGNDLIRGGAGNDTLTGGAGINTVTYSDATAGVTVNLATTSAQNTVGAGTDTISGFVNLTGSAFNDTLTGSSANNVIEGGAGNDTINGGNGTDTLVFANASAGVTVNLATITAQNTGGAGTDTISAFENLTGSAFNDTLTGTTGDNVVEGGAGNDTMDGSSGIDTLSYASATAGVTVHLATTTAQSTGGAGTDTVSNFENFTGSAFNDNLTGTTGNNIIEGGAGDDTINGDSGEDTLVYLSATAGITINLAVATAQNTGGAGTDTVSNCEHLTGSAFNDTLTGTTGYNSIDGRDGNDIIEGGTGNDWLVGGLGTDTLSFAGATAAVTVNLATGQSTGGGGTDSFGGFENLTGSGFNDNLTGATDANMINGGAGNDTIYGNSGNDILYGGDGLDALFGGNGSDILYGGAGADSLTGGADSGDTFVFELASAFANQDTVTDFNAGAGDKIDINNVIEAFNPVTDAIANWVNFTNSGSDSIMSIDRDGTGTTYGFADVATLTGVTNLDETTLYNNGQILAA